MLETVAESGAFRIFTDDTSVSLIDLQKYEELHQVTLGSIPLRTNAKTEIKHGALLNNNSVTRSDQIYRK